MVAKTGKAKFGQAFASVAKGAWDNAAKVEGSKAFNVPEGKYIARLNSITAGLDKNGKPFVMFKGTIISDDETCHGQTFTKGHFITPPKPPTAEQKKKWAESGFKPDTVEQKLEKLAAEFQRFDIETVDEDGNPRPIEEVIDEATALAKEHPHFRISVRKSKDPQYDDTVYFNGLVTNDEEIPEGAGDLEDDEDEEEESEDDDTEEEEEETEEEEEEEPAPKKKAAAKKAPAKKPAKKAADEDDELPPEDYDDEEEPEGDDTEEEEEEEEPAPKKPAKKAAPAKIVKGSTVNYAVKAGAKASECVVTAVGRDGTVTLKRVSDNRLFKGVDIDSLS